MTFVVVVLGGIGSIGGALVAGLGLGMFIAFFGAFIAQALRRRSVRRLACFARHSSGGTGDQMNRLETSSSTKMWVLRAVGVVALVAIVFLLPRLLGGTAIVYSTLTTIAIFAVMCYGVDIVLSYLGEVSLGHTLFWAAGVRRRQSFREIRAEWLEHGACDDGDLYLHGNVSGRGHLANPRIRLFACDVCRNGRILRNRIQLGRDRRLDGIVGISALKLPFGFATYSGSTQEDLWPIAFMLLLLHSWFHRSFSSLQAWYHGAHGSDEPGAGHQSRHQSAQSQVGGVRDLCANHRACGMAICLSARLCWTGHVRNLLSGDDADRGSARRPPDLLGPLIGTGILIVQQSLFSLGGDWNKIILGSVLAIVLIFWPTGLVGLFAVSERIQYSCACRPLNKVQINKREKHNHE